MIGKLLKFSIFIVAVIVGILAPIAYGRGVDEAAHFVSTNIYVLQNYILNKMDRETPAGWQSSDELRQVEQVVFQSKTGEQITNLSYAAAYAQPVGLVVNAVEESSEVAREPDNSTRISELEQSNERKQLEILTLYERIEELEQEASSRSHQRVAPIVPTENQELKDLVEAKHGLEQAQDKLLNKILGYRKTIKELQEELDQNKESSSQLRGRLDSARASENNKSDEIRAKFESANAQTVEEKNRLRQELARLRAANAQGLMESEQLEQAVQKIEKWRQAHELSEKRIESLEQAVVARDEQVKQLETVVAERGQEIHGANEELQTLKRQLSKAIGDSQVCSREVVSLNEKSEQMTELKRELVEAKNELVLKETEVTQLASSSSSSSASPIDVPQARTVEVAAKTTTTSDVLVVEVTAEKANLRSGAGTEHSSVMHVASGTRLTVEARSGDWFRVVTPTGGRAYVRTDVVQKLRVGESQRAATTPATRMATDRNTVNSSTAAPSTDGFVPFGSVNSAASPGEIKASPTDRDGSRALEHLKRGINR